MGRRRGAIGRRLGAISDALRHDWRYPAAVGLMLLTLSLVLAQTLSLRSVPRLVDDIADASEVSECIDSLEVEFEAAITRVVVTLVGEEDPESMADASIALRHATDPDRVVACYSIAE